MAWLDGAQNPGGPGPCPAAAALAVRAWNLMGGLDWSALETMADVLGVNDIEALIEDLATIRGWQNNRNTTGSSSDGR